MDILDYIMLLRNPPDKDTTDSDLQDGYMQELDYTTPRNESEIYHSVMNLDYYGEDIAKFCFTDHHRLCHLDDVIKDMDHFIKYGEHFTYKHKKYHNERSKL